MQQIEKQYEEFETRLDKDLGRYIDNYNEKLEESENKKEAEKQSLEEFKKQFIVLAEQTIQPTIEKFKIFLQTKNQSCFMELKTPLNIEDELPTVVFEIRPSYKRNFALDNHPQISFHLTKSQKIGVYAQKHVPSNENTDGFEGEFDIDEITSEFVEEKIANLFKDCHNRNDQNEINRFVKWSQKQ